MPQTAGTEDFEPILIKRSLGMPAWRRPQRSFARSRRPLIEMSDLIGLGRLYGQLGASRASTNTDGDVQKELDVLANDLVRDAFRRAPVAAVVSEELS